MTAYKTFILYFFLNKTEQEASLPLRFCRFQPFSRFHRTAGRVRVSKQLCCPVCFFAQP